MPSHATRLCETAPISALLLLLCSCGDSGFPADPAGGSDGGLIGGLVDGELLVHEPAAGGRAASLGLVEARWGRAVDVLAVDSATGERALAFQGLVIDPRALGARSQPGVQDGLELERSLCGSGYTLALPHPLGSPELERAVERLAAGLEPLAGGAEVPRDATLVLRFDDLIEPSTLGPQSLTLRVDGRPVAVDARLSTTHGALAEGELRSSRLVLDLAPALAGAPGAEVALELATGPSALANLSGRPLGMAGAAARLALEFRAGGVLDDVDPPFVVGELAGQVTAVQPGAGLRSFTVDFTFAAPTCVFAAQAGDVLLTPSHAAEVVSSTAPAAGGASIRMRVRLRAGDPSTFAPSAAELRARWTAAVSAPPECFVALSPSPAQPPATGVSTFATARVSFSEAIDPASVRAFDTFRLAYGKPPSVSPLADHVVGSVVPAVDLRAYTFQPTLPLRHAAGAAERYFVELSGGPQGVRDLAGNALGFDLPRTTFLIAPSEPAQDTGSIALSFQLADEDGDGAPELRGQVLYDLSAGLIRGRTVARFSAVVDPSQPMVGVMPALPSTITTPLNPLGARLMAVWRYVDMGFALLDDNYHNLDVEGLSWAPFGGSVHADKFTQFRMALAHSRFLPDEAPDAGLLPMFRHSGLVVDYEDDLLSPGEDPLTVVHEKAKGYAIDPAQIFVSTTGTPLMPWPMNQNVPLAQYSYWTWRDTAVVSVGGPEGVGADPQRLAQIAGGSTLLGFYPAEHVPTLGLPLLSEYRCYPDPSASGLNGLRTSIALNSSYKPTFRAYSAGGVGPAGTKVVDPDNEPVATGGINPATGTPTLPIDNCVYWGQADFVVRVSRGHSRWLDLEAASQELLSVAALDPPAGTQVALAFRGATALATSGGAPWVDARNLDPYGDALTPAQLALLGLPGASSFSVQFYPNATSPRWTSNASQLAGARYVQARISFVANAANESVPALDGLGLAWRR